MTGYLFVDKNDEIIMPNIFWGNYKLIFTNGYGAKLYTYRLFKGKKLDIKCLANKLKEKDIGKKIILFNFPNNPSGYMPAVAEIRYIVSIIKEAADRGNKILTIIDDAYFGLVYERDIENQSIFARLADLHENVLSVKVDGPTKEDYVWGLRVGFLTFGIRNGTKELYDALESKTMGAIRGTISNVSNLSQSLVLRAFESPTYNKEKKENYNMLKSRYEKVKKVLQTNEKYCEFFEPLPFNSGYFMCIQLKNLDGEIVRKILLKEYDTGIINQNNILRIAFSAVAKDDICKLFENIYKACKDSLDDSVNR
jgi:aspartate/methionine/tyrosine aminotransferase